MTEEQEKLKTKELFQQLKQDDERHAPHFAGVLETALSRGETSGWGWLAPQVVMLMLIALAGGWFVFFKRSANELAARPPAPPEIKIQRVLPSDPPPPLVASSEDKPPKFVRRRRISPPMQMNALISQWRSPTEFLLKTPGERWMKEVPRLGVPRLEIKPLVIEQKNEMEEL